MREKDRELGKRDILQINEYLVVAANEATAATTRGDGEATTEATTAMPGVEMTGEVIATRRALL